MDNLADMDAIMADLSNTKSDGSQSQQSLSDRSGRRLHKGTSGAYAERTLKTKWDYDFYNNRSETASIQKAQFAYCTWKEALRDNRELEDRKKGDLGELWTGVYQIIGFYSVFQGVIYQGTTAMSSILSCTFYRIPVILSVLASAATILGIYVKFSAVLDLNASLYDDVKQGKVCIFRFS